MTDPRERIQREARESWLRSNRKNTIVVPTGGGKSKIAIDILKEFYVHDFESVLLLTNSTDLRDENWKKEFEKWGYRWDAIQSECYQTAYRWTGRTFDLVIADEIDFVGDEYANFFRNNTCRMILGMTGFVTQEKEQFLETLCPICYKANVNDMQESGALNKTRFVFVEYPLLKEKTISQKKRDGSSFKVSENDQYKYYDKEFQKAMIVKTGIEKKYRALHQNFETQEDWKKADWRFKICAVKRKSILNNLTSSEKVVKAILEKIREDGGHKTLIISALTAQCNKFPNPYHGKTEKDVKVLDKLNEGEIDTASVVKKVNRGMNLVGVDHLIFESFDGGETEFNQRHGRGLRLRPDQVLTVVILLPMFEDLVRMANGSFTRQLLSTQAARWSEKMTQSFTITEQKTIRLNNDYNIETL